MALLVSGLGDLLLTTVTVFTENLRMVWELCLVRSQ